MITERTLKKWRADALHIRETLDQVHEEPRKMDLWEPSVRALSDYVLRMTQVLLDQHLLRKEKKQ